MNYRAIAGKTLLGFAIGTALLGFMVGAAFVSFVAVATTADAYMPGGGSGVSPSIGVHNSASRALTEGQRNNWRKPLEFDGGNASDPALNTTGKSIDVAPAPRRSGQPRNPR
jgi:hypothetical protein